MAALTAERSREFWRQRWLRSRLILENPELRGRSRAADYEHERLLAAAVAADRGEVADALAPRLVAATVVSGVREVYASYEARPGARAPSPDALLALVDDVIAFARTGVEALTRSSGPGRGPRSGRGASAASRRARG